MINLQNNKPVSYTLYPTRLLSLSHGTDRLDCLGTEEKIRAGSLIIDSESVPLYCYTVKSGKVMAYSNTYSGNTVIYSIMEEGSMMLEANALMKKPALVNFKAMTDTTLVKIPRDRLMEEMIRNPAVMQDVLESISYKFFGTSDQLRQSQAHSVGWRTCNLLLIYADKHGVNYDGKFLIKEKLSQQIMADMLGANRITIVHELKALKEMGFVEQINGYYCVRDIEALKRHMEQIE